MPRRVKDLVDLMSQREGYRLGQGFEVLSEEDEQDERLYGFGLEVVGEEPEEDEDVSLQDVEDALRDDA